MLKYSRAGLEKKRPKIPKYSEFCSFTELCSDKILKIEVRQISILRQMYHFRGNSFLANAIERTHKGFDYFGRMAK